MMNSIVVSLLMVLVVAVGFTYGAKDDIYHYKPLHCFECTGRFGRLCDGDDKQQYGRRDVKCVDDLVPGQIKEEYLGNAKVPIDDIFDPVTGNHIETIYYTHIFPAVKPRKNMTFDEDLVRTSDQNERNGLSVLYEHNGEYMLMKGGQRCWIMKVEYTAHGLIEVYKGCHRNIGDEFARIYLKDFPSRSIHAGYCETAKSQELVGEDGKHYYYSHVTVCFCNTDNCNEKTLPHFFDNTTMVGLEDVEQRRWMKKRRTKTKKNSSQTLHKSQMVTAVLFTMFGVTLAMAVYLIRD